MDLPALLVLIFDEVFKNDTLTGLTSIIGFGAIAIILVNYFCSRPISDNRNKISFNREKRRLINSIINMLTILVYLGVSFIFDSWAYSWIIFIVGILIRKVVELIIMLGENNNEE